MVCRALLLASAFWVPSVCAKPVNITAGEMASIAPYCAHTQGFPMAGPSYAPNEEQRRLLAIMGPTLWHLHHYCWAQVSIHRANAPVIDKVHKKALLESAISDSFYVINQAPPDFILLPEIHIRVGDVLVALDRPADAMSHFERARVLKPDYWPAYVRLADINLLIGRRAEAIALLEEGLQKVPEEPHIVEALARIKAKGERSERARSPRN